jgi:hypothetical protein
MRPALYWDFTDRVSVFCYRRFGTTLPSHLQRSRVLLSFFLYFTQFFLSFLFSFFLYISSSYTWRWPFYLRAPLGNTLSFSLPLPSTMLTLLASITFCHNLLPPTPMTAYLSVSIIIVNVSKSTAVIFLRARRLILKPRPLQLFGEPIQQVDTSHYPGSEPRYTADLVASYRSG